jgi:hypothetical protein
LSKPPTVPTATDPSLSYQWQHLVGGTWTDVGGNAPTLTIGSVTTADAGSYRVVVSNSLGNGTSNTATLAVTTTAPPLGLTYNFGQTINFVGAGGVFVG